MFRDSNILLPTDFSTYAQHASKYAVALAREYGGTVHIVHVIDASTVSHNLKLSKTDSDTLTESMKHRAEMKLAEIAQQMNHVGVATECHVAMGKPWSEIIAIGERLHCGAIVIATHGRTGLDHLVFGSVAERVVRHSPLPVLCTKYPEHEFVDTASYELAIRTIMLPTDFSEYAEKALPYAVSLCREFNAKLILIHVAELPVVLPEFIPDTTATIGADMTDHARELLDRIGRDVVGVDVETQLATGVAYREICRAVGDSNVDLIVLPTHGKTGLVHMLFGSVAEKVVRRSPCPVLTLPGAIASTTAPPQPSEG